MAITPERKKLYGALHAAAKTADLDDEAYRAMLVARTGKTSAKELTDSQIRTVLDHLNGTKPQDTRRRDDSPTSRKIRALWLSLYHLGAVRNPSETALANFAKPIVKVDDLRWLSARDAFRVIEALKDMGARHGVRWADHKTPQEAIIAAQIAKLRQMMAINPERFKSINSELHELFSIADKGNNSPRKLNDLVEKIGQRIRQIAEGKNNAPTV
ncbi:regulatory protein GemA [Magnetospirillum fulvum]|uniref:Mu-like prophage protein gp16 n=1 Tax=Magnetospirillum fulvum MGU-K5 TaxID=1316936 RepID=S9S9W1_MAGFU|nr:regulatory protein GemA [Magnetospirillum fulvum]EPY00863.1 Mu-like prophage protein gp16 [Magnetospirillum fulvum MGU-K5]